MLDVYLAVCKPSNTIERGRMTKEKIERKIAVIFATDVVGYSKHMEADESETIHNLRACEAILTGLFERHDGRLFNTGGDSFLAEFPSAVSAVECAVEFQNAIKERNSSEETSVKLEFRIGINSGDVVKEKDNLLGDGVNIAARLEALAQTNGITVSKVIFDYVKGKTNHEFNDLGIQKVKQNEFQAYDLLLETSQRRKLPKGSILKKAIIFASIIIIVILGVGFIFFQNQSLKNNGSNSDFAYDLPSKPSLAVLPFALHSKDESKEYISLGMTQNITNALSRSSEIFVISYSSAKKAAATLADPASISKALGVKYLLTGSIQQIGENLRVNVELVDAVDGNNVWVDQMDGKVDNLFLFQDQITENVFENFQINLFSNLIGQRASQFSSVEEMRDVMRFRKLLLTSSKESYLSARELANQLYSKDSASGPANMSMGWIKFQELSMGKAENRQETIASGKQYARVAHEVMGDGLSLVLGAWMDLFSGEPEMARRKVAKAIEIDTSGDLLAGAGNIFLLTGDPEAAKNLFKKSMRLTPFHPAWYSNRLAEALIMLEEFEEAKFVLAPLLSTEAEGQVNLRERSRALVSLGVIGGLQGDTEVGEGKIKELLLINPDFTVSSIKHYLGLMSDKAFLATYLNTAEAMGLPRVQ